MATLQIPTGNQLPNSGGFVRLNQILGSKRHNPPIPPLIPISRTAWYEGVKKGRFPKPVKLTEKTAAYRVEDIRALLEKLGDPANAEQ